MISGSETAKPIAVSLFCGCGGMDLGFSRAGFDVTHAFDSDPVSVDCHRRNFGGFAEVADVMSAAFRRRLADVGRCDVVLGGFPCQGFSKAGPKREDDPRNRLYRSMVTAVAVLQPRAFIAENVDGIVQNFGGVFVERIVADFADLGYSVSHRVLQAADFGLPQYRRRTIFVGLLDGEFAWPNPTHATEARNGEFSLASDADDLFSPYKLLPSAVTLGEAIGDIAEVREAPLPDHVYDPRWPAHYDAIFRAVGEGRKLCNVRHAATSVHTWEVPEAFGRTTLNERRVLDAVSRNRRHKRYGSVPNGNPLATDVIAELSGVNDVEDVIASLVAKKYIKKVGGKFDLLGAMFCSGIFKRPRWDEPAPTVLTVTGNPRYFVHPRRDRPFTVRECARLQGFPDDFAICPDLLPKSLKDGYKLVGNAVPPPLAEAVATRVRASLDSGFFQRNASEYETAARAKVDAAGQVGGVRPMADALARRGA